MVVLTAETTTAVLVVVGSDNDDRGRDDDHNDNVRPSSSCSYHPSSSLAEPPARWALLWALLLLGAMGKGGRSTAARQGKDGLVHSSIQPTHHVGAGPIWVVCWALIPTQCACVGVINVTTMSPAVVPIFPMLVGSGRACGLLCAGTVAAKPGWLLWETPNTVATSGTAVVVASAIATVTAIVERVLLLSRGIDVGWGGCWPTAMQNCWMFVNWPCIVAVVVAWVFIDSCMKAYVVPKFVSDAL
jgi:hypothetical protein